MTNEQIEAYLKILDERTRNIMENSEDGFQIVREAKEKLDYYDRSIQEMREKLSVTDDGVEIEDKSEEIERLSKRIDKMEFQLSEAIDEIKQEVKLHDNLLNTTRKRLDNQGTSDVKLLKYDAKMRNAFIVQIIAVLAAFIIPFAIMYFSMHGDSINLRNADNEVENASLQSQNTETVTKSAVKPEKKSGEKIINKNDNDRSETIVS